MSNSVRPQRQKPTRLPRPWDSPGKSTGVGCHCLLQRMKVKSEREVAQSCPTLSDPMDWSLPGSSIHGIFQARVLEWGAIAFSNEGLLNWIFKTSILGICVLVVPLVYHQMCHSKKCLLVYYMQCTDVWMNRTKSLIYRDISGRDISIKVTVVQRSLLKLC